MLNVEDYKKMYSWHWIDDAYLKNLVVKNKITPEEFKLITTV